MTEKTNTTSEYSEIPCVECGVTPRQVSYFGGVGERLRAEQTCFQCDHYRMVLKWPAEKRIVIDGGVYSDGGKHDWPAHAKGFAGRKITVVFHDGRRLETDNLWHSGQIPSVFRGRLPDNAVFETQMPNGAYR